MSAPAPIRPPVAIPGPTGRRPWSTQLLREWAAARYPAYRLTEQLRLGPTIATLAGQTVSPALEAMLRVNNWYADGVIVAPNELLVIESKMKPNPGAVGQVLFYCSLRYSTPELAAAIKLPCVPVVLFAEDDHSVRRWAQTWGCRVEVYTPSWIADYLTQVQFRNRSTAPPGAPIAPPEP